MRLHASFFLIFLFSFNSLAQTEKDVLRYSQQGLHGTARYIGLGGAFGALGGDLSSIRSNPAGIAFLRKNALSFSSSFNSTRSEASFMDGKNSKERFELAVEQIGMALMTIPDNGDWESLHFGIAYDRLRSFNQNQRIRSKAPDRSLLDHFERISDGIHLDELPQKAPFTGEMAYQTFLMDPAQDSSSYTHRLEGASYEMDRTIERSGSMKKARLTVGADRGHRYYFGASLGIPMIDLERRTLHIESVQEGSDVQDLRYEEKLRVNGYGIDFRIGGILRPSEAWRFGFSARSPRLMRLEEEWRTLLKADHGRNVSYEEGPIEGSQEYRLLTPYRLMGSAAYFLGKQGLLSLEYRFQDQGSARLLSTREGDADHARTNERVRVQHLPRQELRAGMEWRLRPFYLRGGYNLLSPSRKGIAGRKEGLTQRFTGGIGYRQKGFHLGLSYRWEKEPELLRPIDPQRGKAARSVHRMRGIVLSGGARF